MAGFDFSQAGQTKLIPADPGGAIPTGSKTDPIYTASVTPQYLATGYYDKLTCLPLLARLLCVNGEIETPYPLGYINQNGEFIMSDFEPAAAPIGSNTVQTQQIVNHDIALASTDTAFAGTVGSILTAALAANPILWPDGTAVTAADICDWSAKALPCQSKYLTDPADIGTETEVTKDATYIAGIQVRSSGDEEKGGADTTADVLQALPAGPGLSVSRWCFTFKREIDKLGNPV